jgi:O-antigen ligase
VAALALAMAPVVWALYQIRPVSAQGRLLIWRVSLSIFSDYPVLGVGFGQLPHYLGVYHGRFFEKGTATLTERMLPNLFFDSFNEYLRVAVEHGLLGLAFWVPFWVVILLAAWQPIGRASDLMWESGGTCDLRQPHPLTLGLSGFVLIFMILSFFYFPSDVLIFSVLFVFCLAGLVSENSFLHAAKAEGQA